MRTRALLGFAAVILGVSCDRGPTEPTAAYWDLRAIDGDDVPAALGNPNATCPTVIDGGYVVVGAVETAGATVDNAFHLFFDIVNQCTPGGQPPSEKKLTFSTRPDGSLVVHWPLTLGGFSWNDTAVVQNDTLRARLRWTGPTGPVDEWLFVKR